MPQDIHPDHRLGGIDLGGTKIESQLFAPGWRRMDRRRRDTPGDYAGLVAALAEEVAWLRAQGAAAVGLALPGLTDPATGFAITANLPATGLPLRADVMAAAGGALTLVNDARAFALSEAALGAGAGLSPVLGVILGTGFAGGVAAGGRLIAGAGGFGGEFGHVAVAAHVLAQAGLPLWRCGCGRPGCAEAYVAGPGLTRIAQALTGRALTPRDIAAARGHDAAAARIWQTWCAIAAEALLAPVLTVDPAVIVLGGGLSQVPGVADDLAAALRAAQIPGLTVPPVRIAAGGDSSGARGAALAAWQEGQDG